MAGRLTTVRGIQRAITEACRHNAALVVYSLSRLARSTKDAITISEKLEKGGADLVSLSERIDTTSAAGKMIFRMLAVLAEFERDLISERTSTALAHLKSKSQRVGAVPFGFDLAEDGHTLVPNGREQEAIQLMRSLKSAGLTYRALATELEARQIPTKNGRGKWHHQLVWDVLKREAA